MLDLPGGTKIATIHAFCQSLLRRFPLEAGVPPEFAVMDERSAKEALVEAAEGVILAARAERETAGGLAEALGIVAGYAPEERFFELMGDIAAERGKLRTALADGEAALRRRLCGRLAVPLDATADGLVAAFCARGAGDEAGLRMAAAALAEGSRTDQQRGAILARWCENAMQRRDMLDQYIGAFLTEQGEIRQVLITRPARPRPRRSIPAPCCRPKPSASCASRPTAPARAGRRQHRAGAARRRAARRL